MKQFNISITVNKVKCILFDKIKVSNGNRNEWSPIRSVIIRVITKSYDRENDYSRTWTTRKYSTDYKCLYTGKLTSVIILVLQLSEPT